MLEFIEDEIYKSSSTEDVCSFVFVIYGSIKKYKYAKKENVTSLNRW